MFFIRHGQSVFNAMLEERGFDPQIPDPPLTPRGREQVEKAMRHLKGKKIDLVLSSPFTRAIQTAEIVAAAVGAPLLIEPLAGERRLYSCDFGSERAALEEAFPSFDFSALPDGTWWLPFPEGAHAFSDRIEAFRDKWAAQDQTQRIITASHMYFINAMTGATPMNAEMVQARL